MKIMGMILMTVTAAAAGPEQKVSVCMKPINHEVYSAQAQVSKRFSAIGVKLNWQDLKNLKKCYTSGSLVITVAYGTPDKVLPSALANTDYEHARVVVFYDRVRKQLPGKETPVLAHVLAHEITHALQGIGHHSAAGLMKARWEPKDFSEMLFKPLPFATEDVELIHRGLDSWESRLTAGMK
jgi:hypothetical protein